MKVLVPDKAKILIEAQRWSVGDLRLQDNLQVWYKIDLINHPGLFTIVKAVKRRIVFK